LSSAEGTPLFQTADTDGMSLGPAGTVADTVAGSFAHVIDRAD
jgi:cobyrinic acid a,c-diamide synthase